MTRRVSEVVAKLQAALTFVQVGIVRPMWPLTALRMLRALSAWGPTPAAGYTVSAIKAPQSVAVEDEQGIATFSELDQRSNALARGLRNAGVMTGDGVGLMCRNHRGLIEATVACSKLGAHALYLNTSFAGPQITDVVLREDPRVLIYDEEFIGLCSSASVDRESFIAWHDGEPASFRTLEHLIASSDSAPLEPPVTRGRVVILTSGTTGTPKGATRKQPDSIAPAAALLERIPLQAQGKTLIAAPLFHTWGYAHFTIGMALSSNLVLRRRFDPEDTLATIEQTGATALIVVPVMLQRILDLGEEIISKYDTSSLTVIAASGSALPGELATRVMDTFGDVLYNLYGSTEVAWATIATPADLRAAPGTAGRPPRGTTVALYDERGMTVPHGKCGRIFVGNELLFEGYTGGGGKAVIDGLMSTGDTGHFDDDQRLFIDGRDDEMIVSGGENVFPREVEDLLSVHQDVDDVAVIGVSDEKFGQRLRAFVVMREGGRSDEEQLQTYVRENLARYKVPREIIFIPELPRNATGKVLKRELALIDVDADVLAEA